MEYKGHHLFQQVSLPKIALSLHFLKENSPDFTDITLDMDALILRNDDGLVQSADRDTASDTVVMNTSSSVTNNTTESIDTLELPPTVPIFDEGLSIPDLELSSDDTSLNTAHNNTHTMTGSSDTEAVPQKMSNTNESYQDDIHDTSTPMVSCLQPEDLTSHVTVDSTQDILYNMAPAQGNKPVSVFDMETQAFPYLFPQGRNGYLEDRNRKIGYGRYVNTRLFSADSRFASDPQYIFYCQYVSELKRINSSFSIAMRKESPSENNITASVLKDPDQRRNILKTNQGYHFLTNTRGSPPYWEKTLRDLFAMVKQLSTPTWFCSFSAADRRWPEIIDAICKQQGKSVPQDMDWSTYTQLINSNPVTACRMFENRVQNFISKVILSPANPIGKVVDYFIRTEFQSRGWPHIHCLFWREGAPKFDPRNPNNTDFLQFIDQYIACGIPNKEDMPSFMKL